MNSEDGRRVLNKLDKEVSLYDQMENAELIAEFFYEWGRLTGRWDDLAERMGDHYATEALGPRPDLNYAKYREELLSKSSLVKERTR